MSPETAAYVLAAIVLPSLGGLWLMARNQGRDIYRELADVREKHATTKAADDLERRLGQRIAENKIELRNEIQNEIKVELREMRGTTANLATAVARLETIATSLAEAVQRLSVRS